MTTPTLQELGDRQEIIDLLIRYATTLDSRDWPTLHHIFVPDVIADFVNFHCEGIDQVVDTCRGALGGLTSSQHLLGNFAVEIDGDRATSACYLHAMHYYAPATGLKTFIIAGTYRDALVRTVGGWRIERRRLSKTWDDGNPGLMAESAAALAAAG